MNKIKQILIGATLIALSGNATAMMINVDGTTYHKFKNLIPVIEEIVSGELDTDLSELKHKKLAKKYDKFLERKATHGERKSTRKAKRGIKRKLAKWNVSGVPRSTSPLVTVLDGGEGGNGSIPEPSTLALLGLGLVGIGAARRLRKKAH